MSKPAPKGGRGSNQHRIKGVPAQRDRGSGSTYKTGAALEQAAAQTSRAPSLDSPVKTLPRQFVKTDKRLWLDGSYDELEAKLGPPQAPWDETKSSAEWYLETPDGKACIFNTDPSDLAHRWTSEWVVAIEEGADWFEVSDWLEEAGLPTTSPTTGTRIAKW